MPQEGGPSRPLLGRADGGRGEKCGRNRSGWRLLHTLLYRRKEGQGGKILPSGHCSGDTEGWTWLQQAPPHPCTRSVNRRDASSRDMVRQAAWQAYAGKAVTACKPTAQRVTARWAYQLSCL